MEECEQIKKNSHNSEAQVLDYNKDDLYVEDGSGVPVKYVCEVSLPKVGRYVLLDDNSFSGGIENLGIVFSEHSYYKR